LLIDQNFIQHAKLNNPPDSHGKSQSGGRKCQQPDSDGQVLFPANYSVEQIS